MTAAEREARARALDRGGRRIEVMVLVKTTPVPSTKYEDTVCVAGWALSPGPPRWVRLYPIPYRHIDARQQFPKYAVMSVEVGAPHSDPRAESLRVTLDSIRVTQELPADGRDRHREMARIPLTTACSLRDGIRADVNGPSLGLVTPHQLRLETAPHPGWSPREEATIRRWAQQGALPLDGVTRRPAPPLEAPPLRAWYRYTCDTPGCKGHRQGILDWELTALQRRAQGRGADVQEWVRDKYGTQVLDTGRLPYLVLGNQAEASRRQTFSVLSVYWPTHAQAARGAADASTLF